MPTHDPVADAAEAREDSGGDRFAHHAFSERRGLAL